MAGIKSESLAGMIGIRTNMNKILNFAFIPLLVSAALRFFVAQQAGVEFGDFRSLQDWEKWTYGVSAALAALSFWHLVIRNRCPRCRETDPRYKGEQEFDRYVGSKTVNGKDGQGRTTTHHVSTTFVKFRSFFECHSCGHEWYTEGKRELS